MNSVENLGKLISQQIKKTAAANKGVPVELGSIGPNLALFTDSFGEIEILKGQYMVTQGVKTSALYKSGARVLVAWVGAMPIVIDVVVRS